MYSCGPLHMDEQRLDNQLELIYNSSVLIQDVAWELPGVMDNRDGWQERVRETRASSTWWWWRWWWIMLTCVYALKYDYVSLNCHYSKNVWCINFFCARGVMVIVAGIGHGNTSSNPGLIAFHIALIPLGKVWIQWFSLQLWVNSRAD